VLDSYNNPTYANGQAASIDKQSIPLVNVMRPADQWQYYGIIYTAPRFDGSTLNKPAYVTVKHNGVLVKTMLKFRVRPNGLVLQVIKLMDALLCNFKTTVIK
jgi:hypothetical protein